VIRVVLPSPLRSLAGLKSDELIVEPAGPASIAAVLDQIEALYPVLRGTIRDHGTHKRRAFIRYFACARDLSHDPPDAPLPESVASGAEPLLIVGATAGG
jgi:molybdopterin synthase sulfur carrier subunit